jgi:hypothetical protein
MRRAWLVFLVVLTAGLALASFSGPLKTESSGVHWWPGRGRTGPTTFAQLGTDAIDASDGTYVYCTDCLRGNPCVSGGTGAYAFHIGGAWICMDQTGAGPPNNGVTPRATVDYFDDFLTNNITTRSAAGVNAATIWAAPFFWRLEVNGNGPCVTCANDDCAGVTNATAVASDANSPGQLEIVAVQDNATQSNCQIASSSLGNTIFSGLTHGFDVNIWKHVGTQFQTRLKWVGGAQTNHGLNVGMASFGTGAGYCANAGACVELLLTDGQASNHWQCQACYFGLCTTTDCGVGLAATGTYTVLTLQTLPGTVLQCAVDSTICPTIGQNASCVGAGNPFTCCTGAGVGTCTFTGNADGEATNPALWLRDTTTTTKAVVVDYVWLHVPGLTR